MRKLASVCLAHKLCLSQSEALVALGSLLVRPGAGDLARAGGAFAGRAAVVCCSVYSLSLVLVAAVDFSGFHWQCPPARGDSLLVCYRVVVLVPAGLLSWF